MNEQKPDSAVERQTVDPLTYAVVSGTLDACIREMTAIVVKTAKSPTLTEGYDFSNVLYDGQGRVVAQGEGLAVHIGAMFDTVKTLLDYFDADIHEGDVFYCNDPEFGGSHLPDLTLFKPIYYQGDLVFWAANKCHMMDTGGPTAGGYNPGATEIFGEGLRVPPVKLYDRGRQRRDVIDLIVANVRIPHLLRGDLRAQLAAVTRAEERLTDLVEKYGKDTVVACCEALLDRAEQVMRDEVAQMADGIYEGSAVIEDYGHGRGDSECHASVEIAGERLIVRLTSPPQDEDYFQSYGSNTKGMVYYAILSAIDPSVPHNEGLYRPVTVDLGCRGTKLNAASPAACGEATGVMADVAWEAVADALAKAVPEKAAAGWCSPYCVIFSGIDPRTGGRWADLSTAGWMGGAGALRGMDGWDGIGGICVGGALHYGDVEMLEYKEPIIVWRHELRIDSACPGRWRGGVGTVHEVEVVSDVEITVIGEGTRYPPPSRQRADTTDPARKVHRKWLEHIDDRTEELIPQSVVHLRGGTRVVSHTAGGGGVGDPLERDVEAVERDVANGVVSLEAAREEYGVIMTEAGKVDRRATERRRAPRRQEAERPS